MRKFILSIFIIFIFFLFSCKSLQKADITEKNHYTIISFNPYANNLIFENAKPTNLSNEEISELEYIIKPKIQKNISQHKYFRQYIAAINSAGEKLVWINFICEQYYDPEFEIFIAEFADGGNCFFEVKVNLTKKDCYFYKENLEG